MRKFMTFDITDMKDLCQTCYTNIRKRDLKVSMREQFSENNKSNLHSQLTSDVRTKDVSKCVSSALTSNLKKRAIGNVILNDSVCFSDKKYRLRMLGI